MTKNNTTVTLDLSAYMKNPEGERPECEAMVVGNAVVFICPIEENPYFTTKEKDGKEVEGKNIVFATSHGVQTVEGEYKGKAIKATFTAMVARDNAPATNGNGKVKRTHVEL